jgi:hypothetical protein
MENETLSRSYEKLSPEDRRTFDRWIKVNAAIGLIFVAGLIAMAIAGSRSVEQRDTEVAESTKSPHIVVSDRGVERPGLRNVRDSHQR